jgi:hypothetical protein
MQVLAWYIDPNGIGIKNNVKYPYPNGMKKKRQYQSNTDPNHSHDDLGHFVSAQICTVNVNLTCT